MIVHNFDVVYVVLSPKETDSPLIIDPNAVLALTIATESLKTISRRNSEIGKLFRSVEVKQFSPCDTLKDLEPEYALVFKQSPGFSTAERSNQAPSYYAFGIPSSGIGYDHQDSGQCSLRGVPRS